MLTFPPKILDKHGILLQMSHTLEYSNRSIIPPGILYGIAVQKRVKNAEKLFIVESIYGEVSPK